MMIDVRWKLRSEIESNRSEIVSCSTKKDYCVGYEFSYEKRAANHVYTLRGATTVTHVLRAQRV